MDRMHSQWSRLYLPHPADGQSTDAGEPGLIDFSGPVRAMILEIAGPADWNAVSRVWKGVQVDLELPAPAIAVSGIDGYQLWFSVSEPLPVARAGAFLEALRTRYLSDIERERIRLYPAANAAAPTHTIRVPAQQVRADRWSAFVAHDLAPMFAETPWLDIPPGADGQADILCRLESIQPADFSRALARPGSLTPALAVPGTRDGQACADQGRMNAAVVDRAVCSDPKRFLLGVMNDETVELALRIEAAKALLPCFDGERFP